jgi:hypothetical protein
MAASGEIGKAPTGPSLFSVTGEWPVPLVIVGFIIYYNPLRREKDKAWPRRNPASREPPAAV